MTVWPFDKNQLCGLSRIQQANVIKSVSVVLVALVMNWTLVNTGLGSLQDDCDMIQCGMVTRMQIKIL